MLAYPRDLRGREGEVVLGLAEELIADGAPVTREAVGLLAGGLRARLAMTGVPWRASLQRLGLPLASLLMAAMLCSTGLDTFGGNWVGWTAGIGIVGGAAAVVGLAVGRRRLAVPGAALVMGVCCVDGLRDHYGSGSRWVALSVDVLPALLPAAVVLLVCAIVVRPRGAAEAARALTWALAGAGALVVTAIVIREHTTTGTTVLVAAGALAAAFVAAGTRGGADLRAAAALALSAAAPATLWSLAATGPLIDAAPIILLGGGLGTAAAALRLMRAARGS
jgi:hypothetical protein